MTTDVLKEIGRVDELGSGVRNSFKYCGIYTPGTIPTFTDDDVFRTIIPIQKKLDLKKNQFKFADSTRKVIDPISIFRKNYGRITEELRKKCGRNHGMDECKTSNNCG